VAGGRGPALVSVVVTTKNEEGNIETCLRSVAAQTYAPTEIIVVDNASTDRTKEIAHRFTDRVYDAGPERSAQRNFGMLRVARGTYVMYLDADMVISPGLVKACVDRMSRGDCVALHVPEIVLGRRFFSRVRRFERRFYDGTVVDAARFFRRDVLAEVGGFDETITGVEDWDLDKAIKNVGATAFLDANAASSLTHPDEWELAPFIRQAGVDPSAYGGVVYHDESEFNLGKYLRKKRYYTSWLAAYEQKWGRDDPDIAKQLGPGYRLFGVFVEDGKWRRLLRNPTLASGMYFLRAAVSASYLLRRVRRGSPKTLT
jgi:glycosyltransferase involved in cell wall biosynthesis